MTISVLTDNRAGEYTDSEHGLSYLVEYDGHKILFDTGQSDLFLKNAALMNINLTDYTEIVLSHGHFDHGNGLAFIEGGKLICHPSCFEKRYRRADKSYIGLNATREDIENRFSLIATSEPYAISERIMFLGEIPRRTDFEALQTNFVFENDQPDFVEDDSGIALRMEQGLFVITGCGHAGLVNTIKHAMNLFGEDRIFGVMGGFHLKEANRQTRETVAFLKKYEVQHVYPSHCTAEPALVLFRELLDIQTLRTGDVLNFKEC